MLILVWDCNILSLTSHTSPIPTKQYNPRFESERKLSSLAKRLETMTKTSITFMQNNNQMLNALNHVCEHDVHVYAVYGMHV